MPELSTQRLGFYINGRVALALLSHDEDDPACCPSMLVTRSMLGLLFPPFTTLMYVAVAPGGIPGWAWLWASGQAKAGDNQLTNQAKK